MNVGTKKRNTEQRNTRSHCKTKQREKIEPYTQKRRLGTKRNRDLQIKMDIFIVEIHGISFYSVHIWTWAYTICYMCARFVCTTFARARLHINIINRVHVFRSNFGFYAYSFLWTTELSYKYADETACRTFFHIKFFCCSSFSMPFGFCSLELIFAIFVGQVCAFLYKPKQKKNDREDIANEKATSTLLLPSLILVSAISFMMPNLMNLLHSQKRTYQRIESRESRKKRFQSAKQLAQKV